MGLDISHDTWHGGYSAFHHWRSKIADVIGLPPLELMEGFYDSKIWYNSEGFYIEQLKKRLPIKWESLREDPIYILLHHSDCDGEIPVNFLPNIIKRLEEIIFLLPDEDVRGHIGNWRDKTQTFIDGCKKAVELNEPLEFR